MAALAKEKIATIHASSKIEEVQLSKLHVDRSYQREVQNKLVDEIVAEWDEIASELLLVSNRGPRSADGAIDGGLFIVNGQHRYAAALKLGIPELWARIIDLRKEPDPGMIEAGFRLKTNRGLRDRPGERWKAQIRMGDEDSLAIEKILRMYDTEINFVPRADYGINSVTAIEAIFAIDRGGLLREIMEMIRDIYGQLSGKTVSVYLLKSIGWFIDSHHAEANRSMFVSRMSSISISAFEARSRALQGIRSGTLWVNAYMTMLEIYNEKLDAKNRLEPKLRGASTAYGSSSNAWKGQ